MLWKGKKKRGRFNYPAMIAEMNIFRLVGLIYFIISFHFTGKRMSFTLPKQDNKFC